jgi:hypothetical protein
MLPHGLSIPNPRSCGASATRSEELPLVALSTQASVTACPAGFPFLSLAEPL